ncbi:MAG: HAMP domain-containing histidine kinase [candidate division Zixibacteria bacterium]|nr:HAMP domain-containing histidine kinase [candidate division Zixibacteria bacterium]
MHLEKLNFGYKLISNTRAANISNKRNSADQPGENALELIKRLRNMFKSFFPVSECNISLHYEDNIVKNISPKNGCIDTDLKNDIVIPLKYGNNIVAFMKVTAEEKLSEKHLAKINMLADLFAFLIYHHLSAHHLHKELLQSKKHQPDNSSKEIPDIRIFHEEKIRALQQLAGGLAHELNNLLGGILGVAEFAMSSNKAEDVTYALENIQIAGERASEIVNNLFKFSGNLLPEKKFSQLHKIIDSALETLAEEIDGSGIIVNKSYLAAPEMHLDFEMIKNALQCLIQNALDKMQSKEILKLTLETNDKFAIIQIEDPGPGIPDEETLEIFEPFYSTKGILAGGKAGNLGLGLSVAYGIITAHDGDLEASQTDDGGQLFTIKLPYNTYL